MCLTIPAKVISVKGTKAKVELFKKIEEVNVSLVKVKTGDYVLVSNGFAIKKISQNEAGEILKIIKGSSA